MDGRRGGEEESEGGRRDTCDVSFREGGGVLRGCGGGRGGEGVVESQEEQGQNDVETRKTRERETRA